jgi:hypothetical protein
MEDVTTGKCDGAVGKRHRPGITDNVPQTLLYTRFSMVCAFSCNITVGNLSSAAEVRDDGVRARLDGQYLYLAPLSSWLI